MNKHLLLLPLVLLPAVAGAEMVAGWDFNEESTGLDNTTPKTFSPDGGSQAGTASLIVTLADTGSSNTYGVVAEGTDLNDMWNTPAEVGNSYSYGRGWRSDVATLTIDFDASSFTQAVELSFAINRIESQAVDTYQPSYSTNGGVDFTDLGGPVAIELGTWNVDTIDFGTLLNGSSDAQVRLTFTGGDANWNPDHRTNLDNVALSTVPEPSIYAAIFGGLALAGVFLRRRR